MDWDVSSANSLDTSVQIAFHQFFKASWSRLMIVLGSFLNVLLPEQNFDN